MTISISIKVLTTGISIDINTESPQTTNDTIKPEALKLDDYEGLKKLLPLYDDDITECADITAHEDDAEKIVIEDSDDDEDEDEDEDDEETIATDDSDDDEDDDEENDDEETDNEVHISKISRLN